MESRSVDFTKLGKEALDCVKNAVSSFWNSVVGFFDPSLPDSLDPDIFVPTFQDAFIAARNSHKYLSYYLLERDANGDFFLLLFQRGALHVSLSPSLTPTYYNVLFNPIDVHSSYYFYRYTYDSNTGKFSDFNAFSNRHFLSMESLVVTNAPIFDTEAEARSYLNFYSSSVKKNLYTTPENSSAKDNSQGLSLPAAAPKPLAPPSNDDIHSIAKTANPATNEEADDEEAALALVPPRVKSIQEALQGMIDIPGTSESEGTNTSEATSEVTGEGTKTPEEIAAEEAAPFMANLTTVFPFCLPFDIIALAGALDAEPEAPKFEFSLEVF